MLHDSPIRAADLDRLRSEAGKTAENIVFQSVSVGTISRVIASFLAQGDLPFRRELTMKIVPLITAAAVAVVALPLAAAPAATKAGVSAPSQIHVSIGDRHRRHHGWRQVCRWQWRHHHRVRICRRVRW
jgi:hypothetical protein